MATPTEQLVKVQDQIIDTIASVQKPVIEAVEKLAKRAEPLIPEVPVLPGTSKLPTVDVLVATQFKFAEKLLTQQKDFTNALLEAVKPVSSKVILTEAPAAKVTKSAKSVAAA